MNLMIVTGDSQFESYDVRLIRWGLRTLGGRPNEGPHPSPLPGAERGKRRTERARCARPGLRSLSLRDGSPQQGELEGE